jgi:2-oxoglutarate ferredoxin oxidoreductase subunit gamma
MEKYEPLVKAGGVLVYNRSLISSPPQRTDLKYVAVPATELATELGEVKIANMVALGALVMTAEIVPLPALSNALHQQLQAKPAWLALNEQALQQGAQLAAPLP